MALPFQSAEMGKFFLHYPPGKALHLSGAFVQADSQMVAHIETDPVGLVFFTDSQTG